MESNHDEMIGFHAAEPGSPTRTSNKKNVACSCELASGRQHSQQSHGLNKICRIDFSLSTFLCRTYVNHFEPL
jgi:hypothetical protein